MKKKDFIQLVLQDDDNCVFTNEEQINNVIEVFTKLGMIEPRVKGSYELYGCNVYRENNYWEDEK